jgi:peptidoglycan/xylan/chitin deacetylase (PgdA/CDA1 family)
MHGIAGLLCIGLLALPPGIAAASGRMALAFDDGFSSWITLAAPELARVGGTATAYVNNQRIHGGNISFADLKNLRDRYGWEIATHAFHHSDATRFVGTKGLDAWLRDELDRSIDEFKAQGFNPRSLAFPYNVFNEELRRVALTRVANIRRRERLPLAAGPRPDGTFPAAGISLDQYIPLDLIRRWIDQAATHGQVVYLYGHELLPDRHFAEGVVRSVSTYSLGTESTVKLSDTKDLCLVPDTHQSVLTAVRVARVEGNTIHAGRGDLTRHTRPGSRFLVGPCYGTRLSDFREILRYANGKLRFVTVSQSLATKSGEEPGRGVRIADPG